MPALLVSIHKDRFLPSVSFSYFILAVPMRMCLGKHSCMSFSFHEKLIWYPTEWYHIFFRNDMIEIGNESPVKDELL